MDAVLQAVDAAQRMMAGLYANAPLVPASPELLMQLHALVGKTAPVVAVAAPVAAGSSDTISDDEFEALLDQLQGKPVAAPVVATPPPRVVKPSPAAAPAPAPAPVAKAERSEEHTSELQSLMRISYAVFCLKKNK